MVTTTGSEGKREAVPYTEHDKLGPLGTKPSTLDDPIDLRAKLIAEFQQAVSAAKEAAAAVDRGWETAVHDSRKALRRARAVLAMITHALPKSERRAVRAALQDARRSLSMVRDHTVAAPSAGSLQLDNDDLDTAKRVLDNAAEALPTTSEIKQLLAEAATRAAAQAEALVAALPPAIDEKIVFEGIEDTYEEARTARQKAKDSKAWFHVWRRRTKELVYELEFVSKHAGARTSAIHEELGAVSDTLGRAVDLIMLRDFVQTHGQGIGDDHIDQLRAAIDERLEIEMKDARKNAKDAFEQKPKKFTKRLVKSVRRDLQPEDDNGPNGEDIDHAID